MIWLWVVALVLIVGASAVIIAGRGDAMTDVYEDRPDLTLDRGWLTADDVAKVRFTTAVRGYRMDEVDAVLDRVSTELAERDALIARLMARLDARRPVDPTPPADRTVPPVEGS